MIRPETPADAAAISALTTTAFLNAPHTNRAEARIVEALREDGQLTVSLVAEEHGVLVGHVACSLVSVSDGSTGWQGLGPISVLPPRQGQGIGSALMAAALQTLAAQGAAGCVLLGDPGYYLRFGFRTVPGLVLPGVQPEYFMALAFGVGVPQGEVRYHPAFGA